ncbi:hypothetical protein ACRALDRAFT_1060181 [Sodiomyces alcalophilus JCM 7366]|uniref:uncharacterized protein n=1 Tax=Sodiomyces alcalophilus JCM 7366 TaxID=591952 RepID=UPI0039B6DF60
MDSLYCRATEEASVTGPSPFRSAVGRSMLIASFLLRLSSAMSGSDSTDSTSRDGVPTTRSPASPATSDESVLSASWPAFIDSMARSRAMSSL